MIAYDIISTIDRQIYDPELEEHTRLVLRARKLYEALVFWSPELDETVASLCKEWDNVLRYDLDELEALNEDLVRALCRLEAIEAKGTLTDHLSAEGNVEAAE